MSDVADDMMDEAQRWADEAEVCPACRKWYLPGPWGCPTCEDRRENEPTQEGTMQDDESSKAPEQPGNINIIDLRDELPIPGGIMQAVLNGEFSEPLPEAPSDDDLRIGIDPASAEEIAREQLLKDLYGELGYEPPVLEGTDKAALDIALDDVLEKLGEIRATVAHIATIAERKARTIQEWFEEQTAGPRRRIAFLEAEAQRISDYIRPITFGKKKSKNLPHGVVKYTQGKGSLVITDEKMAVAFAKAHAIKVETKETVAKDDLREFITSVGEKVFEEKYAKEAGFKLEASPEKFSVAPLIPDPDA